MSIIGRFDTMSSPLRALPSHALIGRNVKDIGIVDSIPEKGALVILGSKTCPPCQEAIQSLAGVTYPPVIYEEAVAERQYTKQVGIVMYRPEMGGTPALLTVGGKGQIVQEIHGWVNDQDYAKQIVAEALLSLQLNGKRSPNHVSENRKN